MGVLRLLLALAVIVSHRGSVVHGYRPIDGPNAVQAFYAISGFYMALVLDTKYGKSFRAVRLFWQNRYLRLAPTYWAVLGISFVVALVADRGSVLFTTLPTMDAKSIALVVAANIVIVGQDVLMFLGFSPEAGQHSFHFVSNLWTGSSVPGWHFLLVPQAWTLAVELMFYVFAPLLARQRTITLVAIMAASIGLRLAMYASGLRHDPWTYRCFANELVFFLSGMLSYRMYRSYPWDSAAPALKRGLFFVLLAVLAVAGRPKVADAFYLILPVLLPAVFALTRRSSWDARIGELSYPTYISHWLLLRVADHSGKFAWPAAFGLPIACAIVLVHAIERPVDRYRQRRFTRAESALRAELT